MKRQRPDRTAAKAVMFDLGGVLIDLHSDAARRELIEKYGLRPDSFDRLTRSCFTSPERSITELAMVGKVGIAQYLQTFLQECTSKDMEGIRANRLSVVGNERAEVFALARQLQRAGHLCCIFSNTIALHWEKLSSRREYPSLCGFDGTFVSHLIGRAKPREDAFSFVANALKLRMSDCLLIDDTPLNVSPAEQEARRRGCLHAHCDTFDFQALPFYQKLGYHIFGQLDDYPVGHTRYFLQKRNLYEAGNA